MSINFFSLLSSLLLIFLITACDKEENISDDPGPLTPYDTATAPQKIKMLVENRQEWKIIYTDSDSKSKKEASRFAIDDNPKTLWQSGWKKNSSHEIHVDLGKELDIVGFSQLPRQNKSINGLITKYEFYVSNDPQQWGTAVFTGEFKGYPQNRDLRIVYFENETGKTIMKRGRYIRLVSLASFKNKPTAAIADLNVIIEE